MSFTPRPFLFPTRTPSWFLGHMVRSLRALPALLEDIDLVIEARDARLALTSINPTFDNILAKAWGSRKGKERADEREKVVVYTKRDLAEGRFEVPLIKAFKSHMNQQVFFADTRSDADVKSILRHAIDFAKGREEGLKVLVVGMPNVGKSSLLNALRRVGMHKGKAFRTGAEAGITRRLTGTVKIFESPLVYVYDTPGVMIPYLGHGIIGAERGLKLALTAGIKEGLFERDVMVDYLLWRMNIKLTQQQHLPLDQRDPTYLDLLPLPLTFTQPTEDPQTLLSALAQRLGALRKGGEPDLEASATYLIRAFREGKLGPWTLDDL
ncbi:hypothetical protein TREMEDRAFT_15554, partial [Tremella mesenterica DSM 1558]|uniref:uncharacterized protein n=1 Tax=Tremella mesenterica (strain ATCC 24925 / CBS 8224 / DSM 1558 / NBRC 9311 / NRRL Y-6157 / RJB 2259-6 / UBC 559-6) TaxID=578456 RepID=UPI0003F49A26